MRDKMKKKKILVLIIVTLLFIGIILIFLTPNPYNPMIDYATNEDIDIIISPDPLTFSDYNESVEINVEMKNIAKDSKRIMRFVYEYPTESIVCTALTNMSSYKFSTDHADIGGRPNELDEILEPGESFKFSFEISFYRFRFYNSSIESPAVSTGTYLRNENPNQFSFYISLRLHGTIGESNQITILRME
jgi:hypothetical protein